MNIRKYVLGSSMLVALGVVLSAIPAAADEVYKGTFDLPTAAYWGGALLQPGQYTVSANLDIPGAPVFYLRGEGVTTTVATADMLPRPASNTDHLTLENINGVYVVRKLDAGMLGKSFEFPAPKIAAVRR